MFALWFVWMAVYYCFRMFSLTPWYDELYTYYYFICREGRKVGAVRVVDKQEEGKNKRISPIFILPRFQGQGIAQKAILQCEKIHGAAKWELATILQEEKNCYLYEKMGYARTGETQAVNDRLTLVFYTK